MENYHEFLLKSQREKAYLFDDQKVLVPIASAEVGAIDQKVQSFNPIGEYDLECLINKLTESPEFTLFFDKLMNIRQTSSCVAIYCIQNFAPSIGADESERVEVDEPDDWDRSINRFVKNMLRREFQGLYLSSGPDGQKPDRENDDDDSRRMSLISPLSMLKMPAIKIPWFRKIRLVRNAIDANGIDCANPSKDLEE